MALFIFSTGKWDSQDVFHLPSEKRSLFLPTEACTKLLFLVKLEGPVCFLRGSSFHVEDEVENLYVVLKTGGVLSMFTTSEPLFCIFLRLKGRLPKKVKELARKKLSFLTKPGVSSLFVSEDLVEKFSFPSEGRAEDQTSLVKV